MSQRSEASSPPRTTSRQTPGAARCFRPVTPRLTLAAAAAIPCIPYLPLLVRGETLWFRDFSLYFVPMKALLVELWRGGQLPLWDPYLRNGLPFLANPQTGVFYPPSLLLVAFGLDPGLTLFLLLHIAAAGAGYYLFLRALRLHPLACLLGGVAFALGGYAASLLNVLNNLQAAAWVPWILLGAVRVRLQPGRASWAGLLMGVTLAILGGELQIAALGVCLGLAVLLALEVGAQGEAGAGAATAEVSPAPAHARLLGAGLLALATAGALCIAAVQLLPTAELLRESVRQAGLPFEMASADSFHPASLFSVAFPRPFTPGEAVGGIADVGRMPWLLSAYAGIPVVLLACLGAGRERRRWTLFWCAAAISGILLALGSRSPVFRLAYEVLPPFRALRYPEKFLLLPALALPALAAGGLERVLAGRVPVAGTAAGVAVVALSAAGSLLWMEGTGRAAPGTALAAAAGVTLVTAALLLARRTGRLDARPAALLLCALTTLDLGAAARAVNPSVPWRFYEKPWAARVLDREGADPRTFRVRSTPLAADMEQVTLVPRAQIFSNHYFFQQSLVPNLGQLHGYLQQDGGAGIETRDTADLIDALIGTDLPRGFRLLRLMGVGYLVSAVPLPAEEVEEIATHADMPARVVRLRRTLPRAYVASRWEVVRDPGAALRRALEDGFPMGEAVVLDRAPGGSPGVSSGEAFRSIRMDAAAAGPAAKAGSGATPAALGRARWEPAALRVEVELAAPAVLVVTDSYYPGWHATVDGRRVPLLRANGYQRAVAVPAGRHNVALEYRPASFATGAAVSVASLIIVGAALAAPRRGRPAPPTATPAEPQPLRTASAPPPPTAGSGSARGAVPGSRRPAPGRTPARARSGGRPA